MKSYETMARVDPAVKRQPVHRPYVNITSGLFGASRRCWNAFRTNRGDIRCADLIRGPSRRNGGFRNRQHDCRMTDMVKSFGCRQAYESLSCRNPRATVDSYGDFDFRLVSVMARPLSISLGMDADRPLRCASARCWWPAPGSSRLRRRRQSRLARVVPLPEADGLRLESWMMPCRIMAISPGLSPLLRAVRAVVSSVQTPR